MILEMECSPRLLYNDDQMRTKMFAQLSNGMFWYVPGLGYVWFNGEYWQIQDPDQAMGIYMDTFEKMAASMEKGGLGFRKLMKRVGKARACLAVCKSEMRKSHEDWNESASHKCVGNGVIDLKTGDLIPFKDSRDLHLTSQLPVEYKPDAKCPKWEDFLTLALQGDDITDIMQRATGYSLTGHTRERLLFFCYGETGTGKSTFLNVLMKASGKDYTVSTPAHLVMYSRRAAGNDNSPHMANLAGKRIGWVEEVPVGHCWDDAAIKRLVSEDQLSGTAKYKDPITFTPTHKLWIGGNVKPTLRIADPAILARLMLIDMEFSFATSKGCIPGYANVMWEEEKEGILAWMVRGAMQYHKEGFGDWHSTRLGDNLQTYADECFNVGTFCKRALTVTNDKDHSVVLKDAYDVYKSWCSGRAEYIQIKKVFFAYIRKEYDMHYHDTDNRGHVLRGVDLDCKDMPVAELQSITMKYTGM